MRANALSAGIACWIRQPALFVEFLDFREIPLDLYFAALPDFLAKIANIIEYGKHNQPARPFLKPTKSSSRKPCKEAMIRTFEEELKKL